MARIPTKVQGQRLRSFTLILLIGLFLSLGWWIYQKETLKEETPEKESPLPIQKEEENKEETKEEESTPAEATADKEEAANLTTYRSEAGKFELKYPKKWKVISTGSTSISLSTQDITSVSELDRQNIFVTFAYLPILSEKPKSVNDWVEKNNSQLLANAEIKNKRQIEISGLPAICQEVDSRAEENATGGILNICYVLKDDKIISLSYLAKNEETAQNYRSDFDGIIESVKYTK